MNHMAPFSGPAFNFSPAISPLLPFRFNFRKNAVRPLFNTAHSAQKRPRNPITMALDKFNQTAKGSLPHAEADLPEAVRYLLYLLTSQGKQLQQYALFQCFILIILIGMEQDDDLEEMWLFQGLEHNGSNECCFLSKKAEESIEEAIDQFFSIEGDQHGQAETAKLETLSQPSSRASTEARTLRTRKPIKRNFINIFKLPEKKARNKRKITPSPYHNYQKHLIIAIKHILQPPALTPDASHIAHIESLLWAAFMGSHNETKKILYFIFNEQNEYEVNLEELRSNGFEEIYQNYSTEQISIAKSWMTQLAIEQLTQERIDHYLSTRRIKDPEKFKRYIHLFVQELEDGFIKKRFSNRHRSEHGRHMVDQSSS